MKICKWEDDKAVEIFNLLLERKAQIDVNSYGHTILHNAAIVNNVGLICEIVEKFTGNLNLNCECKNRMKTCFFNLSRFA